MSKDELPEYARRAVVLVQRISSVPRTACGFLFGSDDVDFLWEARSIVATLPAEVDPDLVEARNIVADSFNCADIKKEILDGNGDNGLSVSVALAAIKRGRELERGE